MGGKQGSKTKAPGLSSNDFFSKWNSIDESFDATQRLEEVRHLVSEGVVSQEVFDQLVRFQNEKKIEEMERRHGSSTKKSKKKKVEMKDYDPYIEKPLMQSHLYKRTINQGALKNAVRWPKRYFVLYPGKLVYYKKKGDTKPIGVIDIAQEYYITDNISNRISQMESKKRPFHFMLANFVDFYYFAAETEEIKGYWMHVIKSAIRKLETQNQLTDTPVLLTSRKSSVGQLQAQMRQRLASYRNSISRMGSIKSNSMNGSILATSRAGSAARVGSVRQPRGSTKAHSVIMKGSVAGSHIRDEKADSVVVRLQYVEKKPNHVEENPFEKFNRREIVDAQEAPPILEVGEMVEIGGGSKKGAAEDIRDSESVSLPDSLKVEDDQIENDVEMMSKMQDVDHEIDELTKAEAEVDEILAMEADTGKAETNNVAIKEAQEAIAQSRIVENKTTPAFEYDDLLEVEKEGEEEPSGENENEEELSLIKKVASAFNGVRDSFVQLVSGDDNPGQDIEPEIFEKNLQDVSNELGLRPRTGSFEAMVNTKALQAERDRDEAIKTIEKTGRAVDVILFQDEILKQEEAKARENGDEAKAQELAEKRETAKSYANEQEALSAKASMVRMKAEELLAEKEEILAESKAAKEIATEMSKIDIAMQKAKTLQEKAAAAQKKAEAAAKKVYDRAQQKGTALAEREKRTTGELKKAASIEEKKRTELEQAEAALEDASDKIKAQKKVDDARVAYKEAQVNLKRKEFEMKSLAAAKLEAKAKAFQVSKGIRKREAEEQLAMSETKTLGTTSYRNILDNVPVSRDISPTKRLANFVANDGPSPVDDAEEAVKAIERMKTDKLNYDDFTESYYSDEDYRDTDFEVDESDAQADVQDKAYFKEKTKSIKEDEIKRRSQAWVDHEIDILLGVIESQGQEDESGRIFMTFGSLCDEYKKYADTLVGILHKAKRQGKVEYEGEIMFVDQSQDTRIFM